ncbi:MAG: HD domain-containing protein [bacterium]
MRCPGQDTRYWKPDDIFDAVCPHCGYQVEFFKDEPSRKCKQCGSRVLNPKVDFGCATYCKFAEQCLGELPSEFLAKREELFRTRVAVEMKRFFQKDFKRISHAAKVARYAEKILVKEKGDMAVVLTAAYLHDIGIKETEKKYTDNSVKHHQIAGRDRARKILEKLSADKKLIDEVCDIIEHHHQPHSKETDNFKVLYDADRLVNLEEAQKENPLDENILQESVKKDFLTKTGQSLAKDILLKRD